MKRLPFVTIEQRFKDSGYSLAAKNTAEVNGKDSISFGMGWTKFYLCYIKITPETITYTRSGAVTTEKDVSITLDYTNDFEIPKNDLDFTFFIHNKLRENVKITA